LLHTILSFHWGLTSTEQKLPLGLANRTFLTAFLQECCFRAGYGTQVIECLISKCKALSSKPSIAIIIMMML
jgi:hypothetical protein